MTHDDRCIDRTTCEGMIDARDRVIADQAKEIAGFDKVLRSLACWLGVGGYNAETVDPAAFERKIREGVDALIRVETARARGPQISDSEETALLRRVNVELTTECDNLRAALLPFAAATGSPGRLVDPMTGNPLPDDAALGLGVKVSAWKRAMELTGA